MLTAWKRQRSELLDSKFNVYLNIIRVLEMNVTWQLIILNET